MRIDDLMTRTSVRAVNSAASGAGEALRPACSRRGVVTVLVMVAVIVTAILVFGLGEQLRMNVRQVVYIHDDTQHLYFSEQVFSLLLNRLKQSGWTQRFYYDEDRTPCAAAGEGELPVSDGFDERPKYRWYVQDVNVPAGEADGSAPPDGEEPEGLADVRRDLTDVFVEMTYKGAVQSFMQRVSFRIPSGTRPTAAIVKRFARIGTERDFLDPQVLEKILARVEWDERLLVARRATHRVIGRELRELAGREVPPDEALAVLEARACVARFASDRREPVEGEGRWTDGSSSSREDSAGTVRGPDGGTEPRGAGGFLSSLLRLTASPVHAGIDGDEAALEAGLPEARNLGRETREVAVDGGIPLDALGRASGLQSQIALEEQILARWDEAESALSGTPRDPAAARASFEQALALALTQSPLHGGATVPRSLFLRAKALTVQADALGDGSWDPAEPTEESMRALTCPPPEGPQEVPADASAARKARIAHLAAAALDYQRITDGFPDSRDAAHAWVPWGWLAVRAVLESGVDPEDPMASIDVRGMIWNRARSCAYARFEQLRTQERYRLYHLWGEDAVTTRVPTAPDPDDHDRELDEVVYYERELIKPKVAGILVRAGTWSLVVSDVDGSNMVPVFTAADVNDTLSGMPFSLTWSPAGDLLLFVARALDGKKDIFEYDFARGRLRRVTTTPEDELALQLVMGGERIVASYADGGDARLALLDRNGELVHPLISIAGNLSHGCYVERHGTLIYCLVHTDGGRKWIKLDLSEPGIQEDLPIPVYVDTLAVSPDRSKIAAYDLSYHGFKIFDFETAEELSHVEFSAETIPFNLEWSADQKELRFAGYNLFGFSGLWRLDLETGTQEQLLGGMVSVFGESEQGYVLEFSGSPVQP